MYDVHCECGHVQRVTAPQAGSQIQCGCGRSISVPTLSKLRQAAGEPSIVLDTPQRIELMVSKGELPTGLVCPVAGGLANMTVYFQVQCEQVWMRDRENDGKVGWLRVFAGLAFGSLGGGLIGALTTKVENAEEFGRDLRVDLPVRISTNALEKLEKLNHTAVREILCQTPIYAQLFAEYPQARVVSAEWAT